MRVKVDMIGRATDVVLVLVAITMLGMYASRLPKRALSRPEPLEPKKWRTEINTGIRTGPPDAKLTLIEFMDFQCPFCARWAARVDSLRQEFPHEVQVVFHHFPLPNHQHAMQAAVAAECADQQGAFLALQKIFFEKQEEIGKRPWKDFGAEANVPELHRFSSCLALPVDSFPRIGRGLKLAADHQMQGTPTVWVNGKVARPTLEELRRMLRERP